MDSYHDDTKTISKTMLNVFCDSPVEFNLMFNQKTMAKKSPTKQMEIGTVLHEVLLEKKKITDVVEEYPQSCFKSNGAINPKPAGEFRKSVYPRIAVKTATLNQIIECADSIAGSALNDAIQQCSEFEKRHDATIEDVACRCKPDMLVELEDFALIYDLKFCDPKPSAFNRSARMFRYWLQDAHYSAVVGAEIGKPVHFRFFAVEPVFPYRIQCYWYTERQREIAGEFHRKKLQELRECKDSNTWEDAWPNVLTLNAWDVESESEEPELEGFEDEHCTTA